MKDMLPHISIGKENFAALREGNYFFVDKSDFIRSSF